MADSPGTSLDFDLTGITVKIERLQARLANLTPLMEEIGSSLLTSSQMRFETKTAPDGSSWPALASATIKARTRRGYGGQNILRRSGDLYQSLNYRPGPDQVIVSMGGAGNSTAYARAHQMGARITMKSGHTITLPARAVLGLSGEDEQSIEDIVDNFLRESLEGT